MAVHPAESRLLIRLATAGRPIIPAPPNPDQAPRRPRRLEVFATGLDWVQLTWSALGPGPVQVQAGDAHVEVAADGRAGALRIEGLPTGDAVDIVVTGAGLPQPLTMRAHTLPRPPGELLTTFATVSDVHLGGNSTGYFHTIVERPTPVEPHPLRCFRAALAELGAFGAERLIIKGDLVDASTEANWDAAAEELRALAIPVDVLPGNHEHRRRRDIDPEAGCARLGLELVTDVRAFDAGGVRFVLANSTRPGGDAGTVAAIRQPVVDAARATSSPVFVAMHHQPMRWSVPTYIPPGIPGPAARSFLRDLGAANPHSMMSSGHTHRHRRHDVGGIVATEVGSTKDFPGTWAGYQVFEGGIVQTVSRIAEPTAIRWTDHTRRAAGGVWSRWAPGRLDQRCFTWSW